MGCFDLYCPITGMPLAHADRAAILDLVRDYVEDGDRDGAAFWKKHADLVAPNPWYEDVIALSSDGYATRRVKNLGGCDGFGEIEGVDDSDLDHLYPHWVAKVRGRAKGKENKYWIVTSVPALNFLEGQGLSIRDVVLATVRYHGGFPRGRGGARGMTRAPGTRLLNLPGRPAPQFNAALLEEVVRKGEGSLLSVPDPAWFRRILQALRGAPPAALFPKKLRPRSRTSGRKGSSSRKGRKPKSTRTKKRSRSSRATG